MKTKQDSRLNDEFSKSQTGQNTVELDDIINTTEMNENSFALSYGRFLKISSGSNHRDIFTVSNREGMIELEITITEKGPVLQFNTVDMKIASKGRVRIDCEDFYVHAKGRIKYSSDGDLIQQANGDMSTTARICSVKARRGNINLDANDDVKIKGERILLNC